MIDQIISEQTKSPAALPLGTAILLFLGSFILLITPLLPLGAIYCVIVMTVLAKQLDFLSKIGLIEISNRQLIAIGIILVLTIITGFLLSVLLEMLKNPQFMSLLTKRREWIQSDYSQFREWALDRQVRIFLAMKQPYAIMCLLLKPFISACVIAPVVESFFVSAVLYPALAQKIKQGPAMIIVGLIFGCLHIPSNVLTFLWICISGIAYVFLYIKTKSLYTTICAHACYNMLVLYYASARNWGLPYSPG